MIRRLLVHRVLTAIPVLIGASFVTFLLLNLLPGNAALALLGPGASKSALQTLTRQLGLGQPFVVRYFVWLGDAFKGDLGRSLSTGQTVTSILAQRLPVTAELLGLAFVFAVILAVPIAVIAAHRPGGVVDRLITVVSVVGLSVPGYVLGLLFILIFAVHLNLVPPTGFVSISSGIGANLRSMALPSLTIGLGLFAVYARLLRADLVDQMEHEDYITAVRSKGRSDWWALIAHALRNASFSLLTLIGVNVGTIIGAAVIVEQIFALPGLGQLLIQSINDRDATTVEGIILVMSVAVVVANLLVDILYYLLDPRIRYGRPAR